ncbi:MAG: hypothetical protein EAZ62_09000, partial [Sphingobacteriia bacterium]
NLSLRSFRKAELRLEIGLEAHPDQLMKGIQDIRAYLSGAPVHEAQVHLTDTGKGVHVMQIEYLVGLEENLESFLDQREKHWLAILQILATHQLVLAEKKA